MKLTILGNNSAIPAHDRHPTAQIVEIREQLFLVDCGEGTQIQLQRYNVKRGRINYIFISHLHGDHYFGLVGLLSSMGLMGRTNPIYLFAPVALIDIIELNFKASQTVLPYEIIFTPISVDESIMLLNTEYYSVSCFPVQHRVPCHGFLFVEKSSGRKINPDACREYKVPTMFYPRLKKGEDYTTKNGFLVKNEWVTFSGANDKKYAYCADTLYTLQFLDNVKAVDLLYHESTYLDDQRERAKERYHSTAAQAALLASAAGVGRLLLGHFSSKYTDLDAFYTEASVIFSNSVVTKEGDVYEV